jgi:hypothetical protein
VYVHSEPEVVYEQPKPQPVVRQPEAIEVPIGETIKIQTAIKLQPEPIVEQPKPQPIVQPKPEPVVEPIAQPVVEEAKPAVSNREQLMA